MYHRYGKGMMVWLSKKILFKMTYEEVDILEEKGVHLLCLLLSLYFGGRVGH